MHKYIKYAREIMRKNYSLFIITTIVIAITIILTTTAVYSFALANKFSYYLKNNQKISILFDSKTPVTEIQDFINKYKTDPAILKIYQKDPSEVMQEYVPSDYPISNDDLVKIVRIELNPKIDSKNLVKKILNQQASNENIIEVIYLPKLYTKLKVVSNWINIISIAVLGTFTGISMILIYLTLRLGMEKIESEINIMRNIGAPKKFIQTPLLITTGGMILSGGLGGTIIMVLIYYISKYTFKIADLYPSIKGLLTSLHMQTIFQPKGLVMIMITETLILFMIGIIFTNIIINQFLTTRSTKSM